MRGSAKFKPRITKTEKFYIYAGPCDNCPPSVEPWVMQFCSMPENKWYAKIDRNWLIDPFNQYGLEEILPNFDLALDMITDEHSKKWIYLTDQNISAVLVQAKHLYGMLHARYITQSPGLKQMKEKYNEELFGTCPRVNCDNAKLLPIGTTFRVKHHSVKLFCPCCYDIYKAPRKVALDGAHFGSAFPHIFLASYPALDMHSKFKQFDIHMFGLKLNRNSLPAFIPHERNVHQHDIYSDYDEEEEEEDESDDN
ncbi:Casein kinase II regulatory subunit family protein [Trichomonas vaginalis G3]|uniref:Casein kinase II subunit beta n=1 Tax=Trichomonas vaginalis (strain ATCC PRA-98 / G3) TaxID=412133 RepID=A2DDS7_TRIV3|nr:protein kinase regulator protein [Trichomonas vaginalis G3]EAY21453.1 Casein kinase II regulatory subunit family protein [Trichomonas vaginalis G3]KAI5490666.1 protein kinase regulator protein [Trichomonas vaginalis G3]|eukprot:XP_001582439.1 Casein kinase II regulatory subunit family protein [Trichomonas vaginalis G3]